MSSHQYDPELTGAVDAVFVDIEPEHRFIEVVRQEQLAKLGGVRLATLPDNTYVEIDTVSPEGPYRDKTVCLITDQTEAVRLVDSMPFFAGNRRLRVGSWLPICINQFKIEPFATMGIIRPGDSLAIAEPEEFDNEFRYVPGVISAMRANGQLVFGPDNFRVKQSIEEQAEFSSGPRRRSLITRMLEALGTSYAPIGFSIPRFQ